MNCKTAQSLLFDYLFDLLDQDEKQPLENHLGGCKACQGELVWARNRQKFLKSATLETFPEVQFRAEDLLGSATIPANSPIAVRSWSSLQWGLLVAAAVLLLILPVWGLLLKQDGDQGISLAYLQDSGIPGKITVSISQLEKTVNEAISQVQSGAGAPDTGHKALSVEKVETPSTKLKTVVFISDRPLKAGTPFEVKSVTLETPSLKLANEPLDIRYVLRGPGFEKSFSASGKGSTARNLPAKFPDGTDVRGIGLVLFDLPNGITGGPWELEVSESQGRFPTVRKNIPTEGFKPEITQTIRWDKDQYKSGDKVKLTVRVNQGDGKGIPGAKINLTLVFGGVPWNPETKSPRKAGLERIANENGECSLEFDLPEKPNSGQNEILIQTRNGESFLSGKYPLPFWR